MKKKTIKLIIGLSGAIATVVAGIFGAYSLGEKTVMKNIQSQITNINGDNNKVTINSIEEFINEYVNVIEKNKELDEQNSQYFAENKSIKVENESLKSQIVGNPNILFSNLGLYIDGDIKNVDAFNSCITYNGKNYLSKEFLDVIVGQDKTISIEDNNLYIGRIIADKSSLQNQILLEKDNEINHNASEKDSYGNLHSNSIYFNYYNGSISYNLNQKYSFIKFKVSMSESSAMDNPSILTIIADDNNVYNYECYKTSPVKEEINIPINNCTVLTFESSSSGGEYSKIIVSDIVLYN